MAVGKELFGCLFVFNVSCLLQKKKSLTPGVVESASSHYLPFGKEFQV